VSYLSVHGTVEDENKEALKAVEYSKYIGHHHCLLVDEEIPKHPGQTKQHLNSKSTLDPRPEL
jgi:hypothetical protein